MSKFDCHIFVCCNQRPPSSPRGCCDTSGQADLCRALREEMKRQKVPGAVRVNKSGCLDQCEQGPALVIYPQQIWYGGVRREDLPRIVRETIIAGRVLPDLLIPDELLNTAKFGEAPVATLPLGNSTALEDTVEEQTSCPDSLPCSSRKASS